ASMLCGNLKTQAEPRERQTEKQGGPTGRNQREVTPKLITPSLGCQWSEFQLSFPLFLVVPEARLSRVQAKNQLTWFSHIPVVCFLTFSLLEVLTLRDPDNSGKPPVYPSVSSNSYPIKIHAS
ncbi:unnamed protein product, partial [Rangifer tarandus platyrhynchus]